MRDEIKVAAVILTKDEEPRIEECLRHIRPYVDYILVVDGGSKDKTAEIAEKYADKVVVKEFSGSFAEERNYARTLVPKDCLWILWVDADERFDKGFLENMKVQIEEAEKGHIVCFRFPRINLPDGRDYPDYQVRLFRNSRDILWKGDVHEVPYLVKENVRLDQIDSAERRRRLGVATMDWFPILHLPRRKDIRRKWWEDE